MDFNFLNQKDIKNKGKKKQEIPKFSGNILGAVLIFITITAFYLMISGTSKSVSEIPLSDLAKSVSAGEVKNILVEGEKLTITFKNDEIKTSKKETESSLSQTLFNYGVKPEALNATNISFTPSERSRYASVYFWPIQGSYH